MNRKLPQTLSILFGFIASFVLFFGIVSFGLVYFLGGCLFGYCWPKKSWRWGYWLAGPLVAILVLSVAFAGYVDVFLKKDLPLILLAVAAATIGSFVASSIKQRQSIKLKS